MRIKTKDILVKQWSELMSAMLRLLLIWYLKEKIGVNSPLAECGIEALQSLNYLMLGFPLVIIWMSAAGECLVGPCIWSWGLKTQVFCSISSHARLVCRDRPGSGPQRPVEAVLSGFTPSGSPVPLWLMEFSAGWLAPGGWVRLQLCRSPLLQGSRAYVRSLCCHIKAYDLLLGGILGSLSSGGPQFSSRHWWSQKRVGCDPC